MVKFCDSSYPRAVQSKSFSLTTLCEVNEMKCCGIVLMFLVFALPTLAATPQEAACAQEATALQAQAVQLKADMDVFNRECGGTRTKSEYAAKNCAQRGANLDQRNANLDAAIKSHNARCK
jgi:hypothetical protein